MKKQLNNRWWQIDKFEASVKTYADAKTTWKQRLTIKDGELEAAKAMNSELLSQLLSLKHPGPGDSKEVKALHARANNAECRLTNAQNQLAAAQEKMATMNQKTVTTDTKWEVHVKEYEARLHAAEEQVKQVKQGYREQMLELEMQANSLQRWKDIADKRNQQLRDIAAKVWRLSS